MSPKNIINDTSGSRIAVYVTAFMLAFSSVIRVVLIHIQGHDDAITIQLQSAMVTLFTGSIAIDRSQIHNKAKQIQESIDNNGHNAKE